MVRVLLLAIRQMKTFLKLILCSLVLAGGSLSLCAQDATPAAAPAPAEVTLEQRVGDIEAYMNNTARVTEAGHSKISGPGPGHNAWQMTSTALVIFMTLPGLALFYGGLVRSKNVLSVLAQCMGIAGLVTILWWAVGYSFAFGSGGNAYIGGLSNVMLKGVEPGVTGAPLCL